MKKILRKAILVFVSLTIVSCASPKGKVVSVERLARFEGGGSMSTLWYYGADENYHYFRHLWKSSTPYRIARSDFSSPDDRAFNGYENGKHVRNELSRHFLSAQGIEIQSNVAPREVIQILDSRPKQKTERWKVDQSGEQIRIRKSRSDGTVYPPGSAVEFWSVDREGRWVAAKTA